MEELLLRPLLTRDELDVVDQQEIDVAIARAELGRAVVANRIDELVREPLGRQVRDGHRGEQAAGLMADGVQQMRLAQAYPSVDEERVVGLRRQLGDGLGGRLSELIR